MVFEHAVYLIRDLFLLQNLAEAIDVLLVSIHLHQGNAEIFANIQHHVCEIFVVDTVGHFLSFEAQSHLLVLEQVDAHGFRSDLVITDGLEGAAIG